MSVVVEDRTHPTVVAMAMGTLYADLKRISYGYERSAFHRHERDDFDELLGGDKLKLERCD